MTNYRSMGRDSVRVDGTNNYVTVLLTLTCSVLKLVASPERRTVNLLSLVHHPLINNIVR